VKAPTAPASWGLALLGLGCVLVVTGSLTGTGVLLTGGPLTDVNGQRLPPEAERYSRARGAASGVVGAAAAAVGVWSCMKGIQALEASQ